MPEDHAPEPAQSVVVVGVSAGGELADPAAVAGAEVIIGSPRQLAVLGATDAVQVPLPRPLREGLVALLEQHRERRVVVLASGDPLVAGIATTLIELGFPGLDIRPAVSSVALARAAMGWPAESHAVVRVVDDVAVLHREVAPGRRVVVLSADERTPAAVADLLEVAGYGASRVTVLGDLGTALCTRQDLRVAEVHSATVPRLNVVALDLVGPRIGGWTAGLSDDAFENDGQLTKRDVRASALARLAPVPGEHLWDLGAGAGSVGIEWMRAHPTCTTTAVEADADRAARIGRNASRLGVPGLEVVRGKAPEALVGLRRPDAIFIGGGATAPGLIEQCLAVLDVGGRLVVHGVTLETEQLLARCYAEHGGELTRISVETAAPIGTFTGWTPARAVTQWSYQR